MSGHVGTPGKRDLFHVTLVDRVKKLAPKFGDFFYIYLFRDADGNEFTYNSGGELCVEEFDAEHHSMVLRPLGREPVTIRATVKSHENARHLGRDNSEEVTSWTVITKVTIVEEESHEGIGPSRSTASPVLRSPGEGAEAVARLRRARALRHKRGRLERQWAARGSDKADAARTGLPVRDGGSELDFHGRSG